MDRQTNTMSYRAVVYWKLYKPKAQERNKYDKKNKIQNLCI